MEAKKGIDVIPENSLPEEWESKPILIVTNGTSQLDKDISLDSVVGITREGVKEVIKNWNTYRQAPWISNFVLYQKGKLVSLPTIADKYLKRMGPQVDAIAELYHALIVSRNNGAPDFKATFAEKFAWGKENVDSIRDLTVETMMNWIVNSHESEKIENP
jgi:hypothetical protein